MCLSSNDDENNRKSEENNENIEMSAWKPMKWLST
jgi:hypothetical protein